MISTLIVPLLALTGSTLKLQQHRGIAGTRIRPVTTGRTAGKSSYWACFTHHQYSQQLDCISGFSTDNSDAASRNDAVRASDDRLRWGRRARSK